MSSDNPVWKLLGLELDSKSETPSQSSSTDHSPILTTKRIREKESNQMTQQHATLTNQIQKKALKIKELNQIIITKQKQITKYDSIINKKRNHYHQLANQESAMKLDIQTFCIKKNRLKLQLETLEAFLKQKNSEKKGIFALRDSMRKQMKELKYKITQHQKHLKNLEILITMRQHQLKNLKEEL